MAHLYRGEEETDVSPYLLIRKQFYTEEGWESMMGALRKSVTVYVGNLSFHTSEETLVNLFEQCGRVRRLIMGLNRKNFTPCGFCFVEYYFHKDAVAARDWLSGYKIDEREIRVDLDPGFEEGRQYGRGKSGYQIREDRRRNYDKDRGGFGTRGPPKPGERDFARNHNYDQPNSKRQRSRSPRNFDHPAKRMRH